MPIYKKENKPYLVKVNYTDKYGVAHQVVRQNKSTSTLSGAKKVEAELLLKYSNGHTPEAASKITFSELLDEYIATQEVRKSTKKAY